MTASSPVDGGAADCMCGETECRLWLEHGYAGLPSLPRDVMSALVHIGWPLRADAFNAIKAGKLDFAAMLVRDDEPGCASILGQQMQDETAHALVTIVGYLRSHSLGVVQP